MVVPNDKTSFSPRMDAAGYNSSGHKLMRTYVAKMQPDQNYLELVPKSVSSLFFVKITAKGGLTA